MKKLFIVSAFLFLIACNNDKKQDEATSTDPEVKTEAPVTPTTTEPETTTKNNRAKVTITIDGKEIPMNASVLLVKDKKKQHPGAEYTALISTSGGPDSESLTLHFFMGLKTGTYPVEVIGLSRGPNDNGQMFGNLMGGKLNMPNKMATLTECTDLGDNGKGGHKWSISGSVDETVLPAMKIMLMDKSKNHPESVTIQKISFSNITVDDNWDEIKEKGFKQLNKN